MTKLRISDCGFRNYERRIAAALVVSLVFVVNANAEDWLQFRGNNSTGVANESDPPQTLDNVAWTADLPGMGTSSPVIVDKRVIVTCNTGPRHERLHVISFDEASGNRQWERQFWATGSTQCFQTISMAVPTPASDGERVFAFYSCNDLICLDLEGNLVWYRALGLDYPNASNSLGMSSSPIVVDGSVVVQMETDDDAIAVGLDARTGETLWKLDRPQKANWTSPFRIQDEGDANFVALQGADGLLVVKPASGETAWKFDWGAGTIPSSSAVKNTIYVSKSNFSAVTFAPEEKEKKPKLLWNENKLSPKTASPVVHDGKVYVVNEAGVLNCGDATTGKILWRLRLTGPFTSSPVAAANSLYIFNEAGIGQVIKLDSAKGEIVSKREMGETVWATPSLANGAIYARSDKHLWKFGK